MSYENGTTHYNLPQTVGTDKRDWTDTNQAFADIDSAIHTAVTTAETGATNIQALQADVNALDTRVTSAEADIATNTTDIGLINTKVNTIDADIADVRQDAEDMICAYNEATATSSRAYAIDDYFIYNDVLYKVTAPIAIGGTIVPNTNCMATNVTTELLSGAGDTSASDVTYDGTTSGLSATDVQSAIDEVNANLIELERRGFMNTLDYANPIKTFTNDDSYTANDGDYLYIGAMWAITQGTALINIDNKPISQAQQSTSDFHAFCGTIKLSRGQVVTTNAQVGGIIYILREL